ncbi:MAG: histone deacetylase family protein [Candidatus Bipolaricaulia bacterium]
MVPTFYSDHYPARLPEGHPFPLGKYRAIRQQLIEEEIIPEGWLREAEPVDPRILGLVHTAEYLRRVFAGELSREELRRLGLPWSEGLVRRAAASVGGTIEAAWAALEKGLGVNLGGGTHHAFPDRGEAFCLFNDLAIAIRLLQQRKAIRKVGIIDLDAHQGDGTATILRYDQSIFILDIYCEANFPLKKVRTDIGVGLPEGTKDEEYLQQLERHLPRIFQFKPELVFYQAGVDPLKGDMLGGLALSHEGLLERDRLVLEGCQKAGVPVVITLGGGYAKPLSETVKAHLNTIRVARGLFI